MKRNQVVLGIVALMMLTLSAAIADVPRIISYQGRLKNTAGVPYNGSLSTRFIIYDGIGGAIWNSGLIAVNYDSGLCAVKLGEPPQPALPTSNWTTDTGLTLGITVGLIDPEISPRTRFTTVSYAMHAKDAAAHRGLSPAAVAELSGWVDGGAAVVEATSSDQVVIGRATPVHTGTRLEVHQNATASGYYDNTIFAMNTDSTANAICGVFSKGSSNPLIWGLPTALAATTKFDGMTTLTTYSKGTGTGVFAGHEFDGGNAIVAYTLGNNSTGLWCRTGTGYAGYMEGGKGLYVSADKLYGGEFHTDSVNFTSAAVYADHLYGGNVDVKGVWGIARPADFYGYGGYFEGGYMGARGYVTSIGSLSYYGLTGYVDGTGGGSRTGVYGYASGTAGTKYGVYGTSGGGGTNYGVYSAGDCHVSGTLTKTFGAFKIDHPLDPENKYLQHSFVESPDVMNIYNGIAVFDNSGRATVTMPDWFEALNKDFRYQLTCIGGYAPVYIESEMSKGVFTIAGGKRGLKVSWQVTGIRHDAYVVAHPFEVEVVKSADEKGLYEHPDVFGQPETKGIDYVRRNKNLDANPEKKAQLEAMKNYTPQITPRLRSPKPEAVTITTSPQQ